MMKDKYILVYRKKIFMKKIILICTALFLIFSLFSGCANLTPGGSTPSQGHTETPSAASGTPSEKPDTTPSAAATDEAVGIAAIKPDKFTYSSDYINVTIEVPQLTGLAGSTVQDSINAIFSDVMTTAQNDVKPMEAESKQLFDDGHTAGAYEIDVSYSVPYNHDGILSIVISDYRYLGGAHGGDIWSDYTFDLKTGQQLSLDDLMTKDSGYRDLINSFIKKEIESKVAAGELYEIATFEDIGDNPAFYLTPDAIVFYFQQYEYFPYASGIQQFPFKYTDLSGILKKEYNFLKMTPVVLDSSTENKLAIGDIGQVRLSGNPTTGYSWHYTISDSSILELSSERYQSQAEDGEAGAGWAYIWDFRALKAGTTTITFKYYRDWLGAADAAPEDTVEYTVIVK